MLNGKEIIGLLCEVVDSLWFKIRFKKVKLSCFLESLDSRLFNDRLPSFDLYTVLHNSHCF